MESEKSKAFCDSEIVIGLVAPVGTDLVGIVRDLRTEFELYRYNCEEIRISKQVFGMFDFSDEGASVYDHIKGSMDFGDLLCKSHGNRILAQGAASIIANSRIQHVKEALKSPNSTGEKLLTELISESGVRTRQAYVINQLKRPEEVSELRSIYGEGFYLLGVYTDDAACVRHLKDKGLTEEDAQRLKKRDAGEGTKGGQQTRDTFELADFFIHDSNPTARRNSLVRILEILFGHPYKTPTVDEFAMFTAFSSGLRSADLSRQVGAVIAKGEEILALGANECPKAGGGVYWPVVNEDTWEVYDIGKGRDYMRGYDSNAEEKKRILEDVMAGIEKCEDGRTLSSVKENIRKSIRQSRLKDITEYGRVVHAEMDALLSCARNGISCKGATLYCTTFPCHNCAKHLIAAGIQRVVYVEPYPKSKAPDFHDESIEFDVLKGKPCDSRVQFQPFIGVGPRRFISFFSLKWGMGYPINRKSEGEVRQWDKSSAILRLQMNPSFYISREVSAMNEFMVSKETGNDGQE